MAEEFDKSEEATPYKLNEARNKGQVGKSVEFTGFFSLAVMLSGVIVFLHLITYYLQKSTTDWILSAVEIARNPSVIGLFFEEELRNLGSVLGPIVAAGTVASIVVGFVHAGPVFSLFPLSPDFTKLNPAKGLKRLLSLKSLVEVVKLVLKILFFFLLVRLFWGKFSTLVFSSMFGTIETVIENWVRVASGLVFSLLGVYFVFAVFDLWFSKREFSKQMRMSKRDIKDEHKKREGHPEIKSKRKRKQAELLKRVSSLGAVKGADVIITNPSHVSVALKFRAKSMALPIVVSKGKGVFAALIRYAARRHNIPIQRSVALARLLYSEVEINDHIPISQQESVAEIYKKVMETGKSKIYS